MRSNQGGNEAGGRESLPGGGKGSCEDPEEWNPVFPPQACRRAVELVTRRLGRKACSEVQRWARLEAAEFPRPWETFGTDSKSRGNSPVGKWEQHKEVTLPKTPPGSGDEYILNIAERKVLVHGHSCSLSRCMRCGLGGEGRHERVRGEFLK